VHVFQQESGAVFSARWLSAKDTNRHRLYANTAQSTLNGPISPQSMTNMSPGAHTPGPPAPVSLPAPLRLGGGDQPPEVPGRAPIPGGAGYRQQPLRRDPTLVFAIRSATTSATPS
jgi:hypothetical protein